MITPVKVWYTGHRRAIEVATVEELDALLDRIAASPEHREFPTLVTIARADEQQSVQVLLGRKDLSLLIWYLARDDIAASKGTIPTSERIVFDYGGTPTNAYDDTVIPVEAARQAVREFFSTGQRPTCIEWEIPVRHDA
jgi:hypothetical protein